MNKEINITSLFVKGSKFVPFDLSNSVAVLGPGAGETTYKNCLRLAASVRILNTKELEKDFIEFLLEFGAWEREDLIEDTEKETSRQLNALFLQFVAGDIRDAFGDTCFAEWDWNQYEIDEAKGTVSGRIYKGDDGEIYYYIGN